MKKLILMTMLVLSMSAFAGQKIEVKVKGMVCSFCTSGVEKTFMKEKEVESVNVDMDNALVTVICKDGKTLSDKRINELVTASGFNVAKISKN